MDLGLTEAQELLKTTAANFIQQEYPKETRHCPGVDAHGGDTGAVPQGRRSRLARHCHSRSLRR